MCAWSYGMFVLKMKRLETIRSAARKMGIVFTRKRNDNNEKNEKEYKDELRTLEATEESCALWWSLRWAQLGEAFCVIFFSFPTEGVRYSSNPRFTDFLPFFLYIFIAETIFLMKNYQFFFLLDSFLNINYSTIFFWIFTLHVILCGSYRNVINLWWEIRNRRLFGKFIK